MSFVVLIRIVVDSVCFCIPNEMCDPNLIFFACCVLCFTPDKEKTLQAIHLQRFIWFLKWYHQKENLNCISIDSQPFIFSWIWNPTRFSTRLFFIVLPAICMISNTKLRKISMIMKTSFEISLQNSVLIYWLTAYNIGFYIIN